MEIIRTEDDSLLELQIDQDSGELIESASWWARFSAIVIGVLLLMVVAVMIFLVNSNRFFSLETSFQLDDAAGTLVWIAILFSFAFCVVMIALLMTFAGKTTNGIRQLNQDSLERGFNALKIYFIIYGLVSILGVIGSLLTVLK